MTKNKILTDAECQGMWDKADKNNPIRSNDPLGSQVIAWLYRTNKRG